MLNKAKTVVVVSALALTLTSCSATFSNDTTDSNNPQSAPSSIPVDSVTDENISEPVADTDFEYPVGYEFLNDVEGAEKDALFLKEIHETEDGFFTSMEMTSGDAEGLSDEEILAAAGSVCTQLNNGVSFSDVLEGLQKSVEAEVDEIFVDSDTKTATEMEADANRLYLKAYQLGMISLFAVTYYCPKAEYLDDVKNTVESQWQ